MSIIRPDLFCAAAYALLFLAAVAQSRRYAWLLAALCLWLLAGRAGAWLLPGFLSPTSTVFLYMPQLYIAPACLLFLLLNGRRAADGAYYEAGVRPLPVLFASSCVAMALAHALVLLLVWQAWPGGLAMQLLRLAVSALHGRFDGRPGGAFSVRGIQAGLLLTLVAQTAYAATALWPGAF